MRLKRTSQGSISMMSMTEMTIDNVAMQNEDILPRRLTVLKEEKEPVAIPENNGPVEYKKRPKSERRPLNRTGFGAPLKGYLKEKKEVDGVVKHGQKMNKQLKEDKETTENITAIKNKIEALKRQADKTQKKQQQIEIQKKKTLQAKQRLVEKAQKKEQDAIQEELLLKQKQERVAKLKEQRSKSLESIRAASAKRADRVRQENKGRRASYHQKLEERIQNDMQIKEEIHRKAVQETKLKTKQDQEKEKEYIKNVEKVYKYERHNKKMQTNYNKDLLKKLKEQEQEYAEKLEQAKKQKEQAEEEFDDLRSMRPDDMDMSVMSAIQGSERGGTGSKSSSKYHTPAATRNQLTSFDPNKLSTTQTPNSNSRVRPSTVKVATIEMTSEEKQEKIQAQKDFTNRLSTPKYSVKRPSKQTTAQNQGSEIQSQNTNTAEKIKTAKTQKSLVDRLSAPKQNNNNQSTLVQSESKSSIRGNNFNQTNTNRTQTWGGRVRKDITKKQEDQKINQDNQQNQRSSFKVASQNQTAATSKKQDTTTSPMKSTSTKQKQQQEKVSQSAKQSPQQENMKVQEVKKEQKQQQAQVSQNKQSEKPLAKQTTQKQSLAIRTQKTMERKQSEAITSGKQQQTTFKNAQEDDSLRQSIISQPINKEENTTRPDDSNQHHHDGDAVVDGSGSPARSEFYATKNNTNFGEHTQDLIVNIDSQAKQVQQMIDDSNAQYKQGERDSQKPANKVQK